MNHHRIRSAALAAVLAAGALGAQADPVTLLSEGFDSVAGLGGAGWVQTNRSAPGGSTAWFQGDTGVFAAQAGAADSYIAANFNNAPAGGAIQNWLITPVFNFGTALKLDFWTRTESGSPFADRLQVLFNPTGSTNLADFTTTVLTINPFELAGGYTDAWTAMSALMGGSGGMGRIAFVYDVSDSNNANYIGIDTVRVSAVPEPTSVALLMLGLIGIAGISLRNKRNASV